jgi:hypothetical protein
VAGGHNASVHAFDMNVAGNFSVRGETLRVSSCANRNVAVGGASNSAYAGNSLLLDGGELSLISAAVLRVQATAANLTVLDVAAAQSAQIGRVSLVATEQLQFLRPATFQSLDARASTGLLVNGSLTTRASDLVLDGSNAGVTVGANRHLTSAANLVVAAGTGFVRVTSPARWQAVGHISIDTSVKVFGAGIFVLAADSDSSGAGTLSTAGMSVLGPAVDLISMSAADYSIGGAVQAGSASLTLDASGAPGSTLVLGTNSGAGGLIDNVELSLLVTTATLTLGGNGTHSFEVHTATYAGTAAVLQLEALASSAAVLRVDGVSSLTVPQAVLQARAGINISATLTVAGQLAADGARHCLQIS